LARRRDQLCRVRLTCLAKQTLGRGLAEKPGFSELLREMIEEHAFFPRRELGNVVKRRSEARLMNEDRQLHADRPVSLRVVLRPRIDGSHVPLCQDGALMIANHAAPPPSTGRTRPAPVVASPPTCSGWAAISANSVDAMRGSASGRTAATWMGPASMVQA